MALVLDPNMSAIWVPIRTTIGKYIWALLIWKSIGSIFPENTVQLMKGTFTSYRMQDEYVTDGVGNRNRDSRFRNFSLHTPSISIVKKRSV